ncbi:MAG: enoyl-CoA hydratase/isomerase family protein [Saprospiraceae bacterium]|nr:enoyl-CoA hydratase/isomerase family protein [Saprospiraceae bacterium]
MESGDVVVNHKGQVSWITFSHPQHNSMPSSQLSKLTETILVEGADRDTKVIVLQSAGDRTFCAGANFTELATINSLDTGKRFFGGFASVIMAIRDCNKLVIGRVQGKAVGGGVGLLAATDYCMATKWASLRLSELSIGIGPFVIEPAISRKTGKAGFIQLALNPVEWQTAEWANHHGLYQSVFDTSESMDEHLRKYVDSLASYSEDALLQMKRLLWEGTENWSSLLAKRAEKSARLLLNQDTQQLIQSFISS